jgi:glycosyltransferase involved in cell wall biosynthesis
MNSSKLTFNKPAIHFEEAFPIGNGLMGAMVYGGFDEDTISLTHTHLWSGEPHSHENKKAKEAYLKARELAKESGLCEAQRLLEKEHTSNWSESFLALGDLLVKLPGSAPAKYSRTLDLSSGLVKAVHGGRPPKGVYHSYFASYPAKVIAIRYSLEKKNDFEVYFNPKIRSRLSFENGILIARGRCPYLQHPHYYVHHNEKNSFYAPDRGIPFTLAIKPVTDGKLIDNGYCFFVEDASFLELYVSCFTGFDSFDTLPQKEHEAPCLKAVEDAAKKGFDRLLEVVPRIKAWVSSDFHIYIIGEGIHREKLEGTITTLGLENEISLLGFCENPYPYMKKADFFLLSSRDESFSLVVGESLIVGTPVLATDCSGVREWLHDGMYGMVLENSSEGIFEGLRAVLKSPEILGQYRSRIPDVQKEISFEKGLAEFEMILR